jgi:hypothetical protein
MYITWKLEEKGIECFHDKDTMTEKIEMLTQTSTLHKVHKYWIITWSAITLYKFYGLAGLAGKSHTK